MRRRGLLRLTVALALIACDDPNDPGEIRGFRVTALEPADGATRVPLHARLSATLSAGLEDNTIPVGPALITLGGGAVPYTARFDAAARRFEFSAPLLPGSTYRAVLSAQLRSSAGESLLGPREWTFTTGPWQPAPISSIGKLGILDAAFAPDGRTHLVGEGDFYFRPGNDVASTYVKYATCAATCLAPGNWRRVALDSAWLPGAGMEIELDALGAVHVAHASASHAASPDFGPWVIRYLTCSAACSTPENWAGATIDSTPEFSAFWTLSGFAVSDGGEVHLLSYSAFGGPPDLRYATCSGDCTVAANWTFAQIPVTGNAAGANSLQVDHSGRLHLLTTLDNVLTYSTCLGDCTSAAGWSSGAVGPGGHAVGASMATNGFGRIHVVYTDVSSDLNYAVCEGDCANAGSWTTLRLDRGGFLGSAIAVSSEGRVSILNPVNDTGELHYLACVVFCLHEDDWEIAVVEQPDIFQTPLPGPPRLASGSDGRVRMAYNTTGHDMNFLE